MKTCTVTATCTDRNGTIASKRWVGVDVMRTGYTRGWCTKMINLHKHDGVHVSWECLHDFPACEGSDYRYRFGGHIVRIQGALVKRGTFED